MHLSKAVALAVAALSVVSGCATNPAVRADANGLLPPPRPRQEVVESARRDVYWFADDARQGRGVGSDGLAQAGDFIASRFAHLGLRPLPGLEGYFQTFDYDVGGKVGPATTLSVNGTAIAREQFTALARSQPGSIQGSLAFVGYGAKAAEREYDDFAGIDLKDRIALIMRWEPVDEEGKSRWAESDYSRHAAIQRKVNNAIEAGAKAVLLVNAPTHHDDQPALMDSQSGLRRQASIPVYHVTVDAANQILAAAGAPELAGLQSTIDSTQKPASAVFDAVQISANLDIQKDVASVRNVVACLPGKGPNANEYVVIGAHYDHVGLGNYGSRGPSGQIHNGADDNASGTTALLQVAENLALSGQPDRSVIFVAFTLEELGLIGSRKFVESPVVPIDRVVAMLNLDMVGRMKEDALYVGGSGTAASFETILSEVDDASPINIRNMGKGGRGPSDHQSFSSKGVPVLFFFSGMHPDYHAPGDDAEKINYEGIANVIDVSFNIIQRLCKMPREAYVSTFDVQQPDTNVAAGGVPGERAPRREMIESDRPRLGIVPDYTSEPSDKGVLISGVTDNTAAQAAGLKAGDIVTKLNERKIAGLEDVMEFLGEAKIGDKVMISVLRGGETITLESTLKGRPAAQ